MVVRKCVNQSSCPWGGEWGLTRDWCIRWGSTCSKGRGKLWRFSTSIGLNGIFLTEIYSIHVRKVENISVRTIYCWNQHFIGFLLIQLSSRLMVGFMRNLQKKCNGHFTLMSQFLRSLTAGIAATIFRQEMP